MIASLLLKDLRVNQHGLQVKKTGHYVPLNFGTVVDVSRWLQYFWSIQKLSGQQLFDVPKRKVHFYPDTPGPWYFAWPILRLLNYTIVSSPNEADFLWHFEDSTISDGIAPKNDAVLTLNSTCVDISKTAIAKAFQKVFGYSLAIEPSAHSGPVVEKSEINGAHDGRVIEAPCPAREGYVYQRLIDNRLDENIVEDVRTTIVGGDPVFVFQKRRPVKDRFANSNTEVLLSTLEDHFSAEEVETIGNYAKEIGMDCGGLDVLRDKATGKLYIVDANKTDMGPPLALPLEEKLKATKSMALALSNHVEQSLENL